MKGSMEEPKVAEDAPEGEFGFPIFPTPSIPVVPFRRLDQAILSAEENPPVEVASPLSLIHI